MRLSPRTGACCLCRRLRHDQPLHLLQQIKNALPAGRALLFSLGEIGDQGNDGANKDAAEAGGEPKAALLQQLLTQIQEAQA